jgi:hypothetical protein
MTCVEKIVDSMESGDLGGVSRLEWRFAGHK